MNNKSYSTVKNIVFGVSVACLSFLFAFMIPSAPQTNVSVTELRCEYLVNPLGIDLAQPRLSWKIEAGSEIKDLR
ncbi:MAG: hypothetical protein LBQ01_03465, partial [Prevotellaceae bacterium]|nr:hypothetical protein [Prevotellaceae bacterium]